MSDETELNTMYVRFTLEPKVGLTIKPDHGPPAWMSWDETTTLARWLVYQMFKEWGKQ